MHLLIPADVNEPSIPPATDAVLLLKVQLVTFGEESGSQEVPPTLFAFVKVKLDTTKVFPSPSRKMKTLEA